jgi:hypothetical protein
MRHTGSLRPYRIPAAAVWHLRAARVPFCRVAAHEPKRCGPGSFRPTTSSFFIRGRRFLSVPHAPFSHLQLPELLHTPPFELPAPPSAAALRRISAGARSRSVRVSRHHPSSTLEHSTASSPASPLAAVAALLDRLRRVARPLDLQDLRRRSLVGFLEPIHFPLCSVVLESGRVFTFPFSFVFLCIVDLREEIGSRKPVVS